MYLFFKKRTIRNIGYAVLGFGILFFSITVMSDALRVFRTHPAFLDMITAISNPALALIAGFIFTVAVQSSSATIGLLVTMHLSGVPIPFQTSAFIIFGANIGTSITAVIASIPASRDSKRTALFHITYDIIGSTVFGTLILLVPAILTWFETTFTESARQVANFHMFYNIATLLLLIPFVNFFSKLMQWLVPVKQDETNTMHEKRLIYLDEKNVKTPTLAVVNAHLEICRMGAIAKENLGLALESFYEKDTDKAGKVIENESTINFLHQNITSKLVDINNMRLSTNDARKVGDMFVVLSDIEQIGDNAENIAEYVITVIENNINFSDTAIAELKDISSVTMELLDKALTAYEKQSKSQIPQITELEDRVDEMSSKFAKSHFKRLKAKECKPKSGVVFMDIINDLEKSADNAEKIALSIA